MLKLNRKTVAIIKRAPQPIRLEYIENDFSTELNGDVHECLADPFPLCVRVHEYPTDLVTDHGNKTKDPLVVLEDPSLRRAKIVISHSALLSSDEIVGQERVCDFAGRQPNSNDCVIICRPIWANVAVHP